MGLVIEDRVVEEREKRSSGRKAGRTGRGQLDPFVRGHTPLLGNSPTLEM